LDVDDPFDVLSIKYSTEGSTNAPILSVKMKVSGLLTVPPNGTWRMSFTANAPYTQLSPRGDYSFGLSDRGDQFFLRASTDALGSPSYVYGTAIREHHNGGGITYTDVGAADAGSIDPATGTVTVKVALAKLNAALSSARPQLVSGSVLAGLRGSAFTGAQGNNARSDTTRGGTQYAINSPPTAVLAANPNSGTAPLVVNLDASASNDPDPGDALSYTFDFGDGSAPVTQNSPTTSHTYNQSGGYTASLKVKDASGFESNRATVAISVNAPQPPLVVCFEDDDSRIGYSTGWHLVNSANASAGHFRLHNGRDTTHFASLSFAVPEGQTGTLTYYYGKSTKGGSAEVFIDGISRGVITYVGPNGGLHDPEFKSGGVPYQQKYTGISSGQHMFELRNLSDSIYIDGICLESAVPPTIVPSTGPGATSSNSSSLSAGQQSSKSLSLPANTKEVSVLAEANGNVPIRLVLVDPAGLTLKTVDATSGVAVLNTPVTSGGLYTIKVVNVSLGPVQVWTVATPLLTR